MKKVYSFLIIITVVITSCGKNNNVPDETSNCPAMTLPYPATGSVCSTTPCEQYQSMWKGWFIAKSNLTEDFFSKHIRVYHTKITGNAVKEYFCVFYNVTLDWVTTNSCDSFLVKSNGIEFPYVAADKYLNKQEIEDFMARYPYANKINPMTKQEKLLYTSMNDIKLRSITSGNKLICPIRFFLSPWDGNLMLKASTKMQNNPVMQSDIALTDQGVR